VKNKVDHVKILARTPPPSLVVALENFLAKNKFKIIIKKDEAGNNHNKKLGANLSGPHSFEYQRGILAGKFPFRNKNKIEIAIKVVFKANMNLYPFIICKLVDPNIFNYPRESIVFF